MPIERSILRAILLCKLTFSIAKAKIKPPKNRNTFGCAYGAATLVKALFAGLLASLKSYTPNKGNRARGISAVTGSGIASVAHQLAISKTTPVTSHPDSDKPGGGEVSKVKNKKIRPTKKPIDFGLDKFFIKKGAKLIAPYKIKSSK